LKLLEAILLQAQTGHCGQDGVVDHMKCRIAIRDSVAGY